MPSGSCVCQVLQNGPMIFPAECLPFSTGQNPSWQSSGVIASPSIFASACRRSLGLWLASFPLQHLLQAPARRVWSGWLFGGEWHDAYRAVRRHRAATTAAARRPGASPSSMRTICRKRCTKQPALRLVQGRPHQRHHRAKTRLIYLQAVEETFHHNHRCLPGRGGAMQVEQHPRFAETSGEPVPRLAAIKDRPP